MNRVKPMVNLRKPIDEKHFFKLLQMFNSPRHDLTSLQKLIQVNMNNIEKFLVNILNAIEQGYAKSSNGEKIYLNNSKGIDILGKIIYTPNIHPINKELYGDIHGEGHSLIGYTYLNADLKIDVVNAMRDPAFFKWHEFITQLFLTHKNTLVSLLDF